MCGKCCSREVSNETRYAEMLAREKLVVYAEKVAEEMREMI